MQNVTGVTGAGPIWHEFMTVAHQGLPVTPFVPPAGVRQFEVCADTGTLPSDACPERRTRWFAEDRPPLPKEKDLWQKLRVVRGTNELATEYTPADQVEERVFKIYPPRVPRLGRGARDAAAAGQRADCHRPQPDPGRHRRPA